MTIWLALAVSSLLLQFPGPAQGNSQVAATATLTPPPLPQVLAFDLPAGVGAGAEAKIQRFIVGYFQGDTTDPVWVLDVARESATIKADGSVRILLPWWSDLPSGTYAARVKIRTVSVDSDWSAPSPVFTVPAMLGRPSRRPARSASGAASVAKPPPVLNLAPAIADAVGPLLPKDIKLADATLGFQKPMQFVSAVFAARNLEIAWPELKAILLATPGKVRSLTSALADLRPDRDANKEARKALNQARRLIRDANRTGRTPAPQMRISPADGKAFAGPMADRQRSFVLRGV